jgi:tRNA/rRNA methyltransferase
MADAAITKTITIAMTELGPEPRLAGTSTSVAAVVQAAYVEGLDAAASLAGGHDQVRAALDYCADRHCEAASAQCRACRLWTESQGIHSIDGLCARFPVIRFRDGGSMLTGQGVADQAGPSSASLPAVPALANVLDWPGSLEDFSRNWAGEEFWYIARRVQRRIKHEKSRAGKLKPGVGDSAPVFILVEPQMADNIGMAARAMANFAIEELRLVAPRDGWPNDRARYAASGAHPVIDAAAAYADAKAAMADLNWVCATTARPRHLAKPVMTPDEAVAEMRRRMARGERCGILFGPERTGLTTDDVANADALVMVRVNPTFASLNLAQAVLLMGYEWLKQTGGGAIGRHTAYEGVAATGLHTGSPPASKGELLAFFEHLEEELSRSGHFKPPEKRQTMVRNLRAMFERMGATEQDVRTLRGIVASLTRSRHTGADD